MDMRIDPKKIRLLRETRGWSQEHLAEVAGLSARTVQRIETEGNASAESRMALAVAFDIDAAELAPMPTTAPPTETTRRHRNGWSRHALVFVLVCGGMLLGDVLAHGSVTWSKWPLLGWSLGLAFHWLRWRAAPDNC